MRGEVSEMSFTKNSKDARADNVAGHAKRALDEGHTVFVVQIPGPAVMDTKHPAPVGGVAEAMEAVEALGWELDKSSWVVHGGRLTAFLIYRRPKA